MHNMNSYILIRIIKVSVLRIDKFLVFVKNGKIFSEKNFLISPDHGWKGAKNCCNSSRSTMPIFAFPSAASHQKEQYNEDLTNLN